MAEYSVFLHLDLLSVVPSRGKQRKLIMDFVRMLAHNPETLGDFTDQDESLRTRQIRIIGDYAVTYWADHAVKSVMIVNVKPADR